MRVDPRRPTTLVAIHVVGFDQPNLLQVEYPVAYGDSHSPLRLRAVTVSSEGQVLNREVGGWVVCRTQPNSLVQDHAWRRRSQS